MTIAEDLRNQAEMREEFTVKHFVEFEDYDKCCLHVSSKIVWINESNPSMISRHPVKQNRKILEFKTPFSGFGLLHTSLAALDPQGNEAKDADLCLRWQSQHAGKGSALMIVFLKALKLQFHDCILQFFKGEVHEADDDGEAL